MRNWRYEGLTVNYMWILIARRVGAPNPSIVQGPTVVPKLFWQVNMKPFAFEICNLVKFILPPSWQHWRTTTTFLLSQNLWSNSKCGAESPPFALPSPDMSSILLHHALCPGGWPLCLAFWILLGFGRWEAPVADQRVEGKRDGGIYFPGPLSARSMLAVATFLYLSPQLLLVPLCFSYGSLGILVTPPSPTDLLWLLALLSYLNSALTLQIVCSLNEPSYQSGECHLFPARTLSDVSNKAEYILF